MGRAILGSTANSDGQVLSLHERFSRLSSVRYPRQTRVVIDQVPQFVEKGLVAPSRGRPRLKAKMYYNGGNFNLISIRTPHLNPYFAAASSPPARPVSSTASVSSVPSVSSVSSVSAKIAGVRGSGGVRGRARRGGFHGKRGLPVPEQVVQAMQATRDQLDAEMDAYFGQASSR